MLDHPQDEHPEARETTPEGFDTITPSPGRHWFIDGGGYCMACNLPEANGRHAPRGRAA
jgi:hypothetical protein